jgi:hypothetical protein
VADERRLWYYAADKKNHGEVSERKQNANIFRLAGKVSRVPMVTRGHNSIMRMAPLVVLF